MCSMPLHSLLSVLVALALSGSNLGQKVTQLQSTVSTQEGKEVTLDCSYETNWSLYFLYWYKQLLNGEMIFLLRQISSSTRTEKSNRYSITFRKSAKSISLVISASQVEDSVKYFCALGEPRLGTYLEGYVIATDKLVFGQGTQVIVEPKIQPPTKPSVFIMKNGTNVACLVKDFYPKDVNISLKSSKKIAEFDPAIVISPSGKYSAVKLGQYGDPNSVTCSVQHNSGTVLSTDFEPHAHSPDDIKPPEPESATKTSETCHGSKVHSEKVNMTSLIVLELRMLFVKSVAINFLFTAKLLFF